MEKYNAARLRFEDGDLDYFELDDYEDEEGSDDEDDEESEEDDSDDDDGFCLWRVYEDEDEHKRHVSYCPRCDEKSYILSVDPYCSSCGWDSAIGP